MSLITKALRRFTQNEEGSVIVEAVMVVPMLAWAYAGLFSYWDAYRSINTVQKASYTISDLISRSQGPVNDAYIAGMRNTMNYMLDAGDAGQIRVTSYRWSDLDNAYTIIFSRSPNGAMPQLTDADLLTLTANLPTLADGDAAVLVETHVPYTAPMAFGLAPEAIDQFIVTRPRFLPKLCHEAEDC
ncbi:hypothetical protein EOK75_16940 (plasmid) [Pseudorhodobacter turbinis]|uniref:Pilus assembly protein n=1 Tax=Pseudorhodobacter turbinis TaxID=2500533 RepID=A0A4P8EJN7_9RHOB|nr:hypothetical protein [Pseudorhodobacter turbinis]QCO57401.1 hypothetical protein EOK75_16940 [Pseudorhodobacter turbinis]